MIFQALLISLDDSSADLLTQVLEEFLIAAERCSHAEAPGKLQDQRYDLIAIDLDDAAAEGCIAAVRESSRGKTALVLGLLSNPDQVMRGFGGGANFIVYKPLPRENAVATVRAMTALAKRERRRQFRVPVQLPVSLRWEGAAEIEGIMLDLSEGGMDVLAAKPLEARRRVEIQFTLPKISDLQAQGLVIWANPNGQSGLQLLEVTDEQRAHISEWMSANAPQAPPEDAEALDGYKLSDLSSGGCYVETAAPFPPGCRLNLCFTVPELEVHIDGIVRVVHPVCGMGIEFAHTREQRDSVDTFISFLGRQAGVSPGLLVMPKSITFGTESKPLAGQQDDLHDALLQLLRDKNHLGQDEFLTELRTQRHSQAEATTA